MKKLTCEECGTEFNCGSTPTGTCWCMSLPNLRGSFDLAGACVCPDCMTMGQAKAITKQRKIRQTHREAAKSLVKSAD